MATVSHQGAAGGSQLEHRSFEISQGEGPSTSRSQEDNFKPSQGTFPLRLLLLGKHGAGKSGTGNSILGKAVFESKFSNHMVTTQCQSESVSLEEKQVIVIDTPDLFSSLACAEVRQQSLKQCLQLSADGLHVLLLVTPIGHYTKEDRETIEGIEREFGPEAYSHMIVVFTREDELGEDSLKDYIESERSLNELLGNVGGRYCAFNNKANKEQREQQVFQLLDVIKQLMVESPRPYFLPLKMEGSEVQGCGNRATYEEGDNQCGPEKTQPQIVKPDQDTEMPELRILLMGKRGVGKSAAGNSILGKRLFKTQFSEQKVTKDFEAHSRIWNGKKVLVIDSPEISSWKPDTSDVKEYTYPGPHAFLLVIPLSSLIKTNDSMFSPVKHIFGEKFTKSTIILFTRKEDLEDQALDEFISKNSGLQDLISKFEKRYTTFNYRATVEEEKIQVDKLLNQVESMVWSNDNKPCIFREKERLNIILFGRSGVGKSATGNTILGRNAFSSQLGAQPITNECQSGKRTIDWQDIVVVDTPSFSQIPDMQKNPSKLKKEIENCLSFCEEGMNIFVLVLQLGWFTKEDEAALELMEDNIKEKITRNMIVLFTRKEDLGDGDLYDYTNNTKNKALKRILKKCKGRVCAFNNKETGQDREAQVKELLTIASSLRKNCDEHSSSWAGLGHQLKTIGQQITGVF